MEKSLKPQHEVVRLFDMNIDAIDMPQTVRLVADWLQSVERKNHYVVTPNVDHVVMLDSNATFRDAYAHASLIVADGKPVVWASKLLGRALPGTVPGSDLVPAIFEYYQTQLQKPLRVFLLGAMPGVAEVAARNIQQKWPQVKITGVYSPPFGFEKSAEESRKIVKFVSESQSDLIVFGVGAPKQEIWSRQYSHGLDAKVILCVGATIDFLAGEKPRAPIWMRKLGIEWLHRMLSEPKRLFKRYMVDAMVFPKLVYKEWKSANHAE